VGRAKPQPPPNFLSRAVHYSALYTQVTGPLQLISKKFTNSQRLLVRGYIERSRRFLILSWLCCTVCVCVCVCVYEMWTILISPISS